MNIVKILLVLGLGYVATTQKVEKTRNMLLVVTGLLAFCMFSMEGFTVDTAGVAAAFGTGDNAVPPNTAASTDADGVNISVTGTVSSSVFTFPTAGFNSSDLTSVSCTIDGAAGDVALTDDGRANTDSITTATDPIDISSLLTCNERSENPSACAGYSADNKPPFCECLKKTEGGHYHCNSGWTGDAGSLGKYIAENAAGDGWEFKDDYKDEKVYKCDADMLSGISGGAVELFSGKCFVKKDETYTTQQCLNLCDPPAPS